MKKTASNAEEKMQSFGIAALIIGVTGIFVPFGFMLSGLSAILAFFATGRGTSLGIAAAIINIVNLIFLSPYLALSVLGSKQKINPAQFSETEALMLALLLIQISVITFLASVKISSSEKSDERFLGKRISVSAIFKGVLAAIFLLVSICFLVMSGKMAFQVNNGMELFWKPGRKFVEHGRRNSLQNAATNNIDKFPGKAPEERKIYKITEKNGVVRYTNQIVPGGVPVDMKPLEQVPLQEIIGYRVHVKKGKPVPCKEVKCGKSGMLAMVDGPITIEISLEEVTAIEERSQVGEKISIRMLRPDAF